MYIHIYIYIYIHTNGTRTQDHTQHIDNISSRRRMGGKAVVKSVSDEVVKDLGKDGGWWEMR